LPKLSDEIKGQSLERQQVDQNIIKKSTEELLKVNNIIQQEKKLREENEQKIFDTLKAVVNKIKNDIEMERVSRYF